MTLLLTILAVGTQGDVQPYVALGRGLLAAGHDVRIAAPFDFEPFIRSHGLGYARLEGNFRELMASEPIQRVVASRNPMRDYRGMMKVIRQILEAFTADAWQACQGSDAIIYSSVAVPGYSVAEKLGIPSCWAPLQPMTRTRAFPSTLLPTWNRSGTLRWLSHLLEEQLAWQPSRAFMNHWRQDVLGLKPFPFGGPQSLLQRRRYPIIYGFSPSMLPPPLDWGEWIHVTGY